MNLEELRRIREQERSTDSLQDLRADFYDEVSNYLGELRSERDEIATQADDPFTDGDVRRLSDELQAAERTVEALYERRVGKIVKLASFAAADMAVEADGLTTEETELFETILETIRAFSDDIDATLHATNRDLDESTYRGDSGGMEGNDREGESQDIEPSEDTPNSDPDENEDAVIRKTVRITDDVGPIVGVDERNYELSCDDIVTLPEENAVPLIDGGAAEPIE